MANPSIKSILFSSGNAVLYAGSGAGAKKFTFPLDGAGTGPPDPGVPEGRPDFVDDFGTDDAARWLRFSPGNWPPVNAAGVWARTFYYGWPDNTGGQDPAARTLPGNKELQSYEDRAVTLGAGGLVLTATRDPANHHGMPWTSGAIVQNRALSKLYGYFEMTAVLPGGQGVWPAFWLLSADLHWPPEIDVMEMVGKDENNVPSDKVFRQGVIGGAGVWPRVEGLTAGLHRFGVLWGPERIVFTVDGVETLTQPTPADCKVPMYMLCNLAIGGTWPGNPPASLQRAEMTIRRVASYAPGSWGAGKFPATG